MVRYKGVRVRYPSSFKNEHLVFERTQCIEPIDAAFFSGDLEISGRHLKSRQKNPEPGPAFKPQTSGLTLNRVDR